MTPTYLVLLVTGLLFPVTLIFLEVGRRLGQRRLVEDPEGARAGAGAVEGAVFALFGLLIAFTFTSAASRYETRRDLIVQHANAIGTAWLRLDLLPKEVQPLLRKNFRQYLDAVIKIPHKFEDMTTADQMVARVIRLQDEIWKSAETAASRDGRPQVATLVLPALNEMFDLGATRYAAVKFHVSLVIFWFLFVLSMLASLLVGYGIGSAHGRNWLYMILFSLLVTLTLSVIIDIELPRHGFIRLDKADNILVELRESMQ